MSLEPGIRGVYETLVDSTNTADSVGSGGLPVFATPAMIAYMELAASSCVQPLLDAGKTTVGTRVSITHDAATPIGMKVRAEAELTEIDGKRLVFAVSAYDECGMIGSGIHERCIITADRFMERTGAKLKHN